MLYIDHSERMGLMSLVSCLDDLVNDGELLIRGRICAEIDQGVGEVAFVPAEAVIDR